MSTKPRIEPALSGRAADFGSVMAHVPEITGRFFALYAEFWQHGVVPAKLKELIRVRNARVTDCGY